jgi:hypothetical protein
LAELASLFVSLDPGEAMFLIALCGAAAAWGAYRAWRDLHAVRLVEDMPTARAGSAHQGYVELQGRARLMDGPPIIAPLSREPCVWYRYVIEERLEGASGQNHKGWKVTERGASDDCFWLEDDSGRVVVNPEGAQVTAELREIWYGQDRRRRFTGPAAKMRGAISIHAMGATRRYTEERIPVGSQLYALGLLKNIGNHMHQPTDSEHEREILAEWKRDQTALKKRFDLNGDGVIDAREWLAARAAAQREARARRERDVAEFNEPINLLRATGDRRRPFVLSSLGEELLLRRLRRRVGMHLVQCFAGGCAAIWLLNLRIA